MLIIVIKSPLMYLGALRCLIEGGGNVAFVKHSTVYENADGKRKQWWARNTLSYDFQLLCPDGKFCTFLIQISLFKIFI